MFKIAAADGHLPLTVVIIADKRNVIGYAAGVGEEAGGSGVSGIDLPDIRI